MSVSFAILAAASLTVQVLGEAARPLGAEGLSGITHIGGNKYLTVEDRAGRLHEVTVQSSSTGISFNFTRTIELKGRADLEDCALDPLTGNIWVSDEKDTSVNAFNYKTGVRTASLEIPEVYKKGARRHRSLEALTISPDGLKLYMANEENLIGDPTNTVRIQEFARKSATDKFRPTRQFKYKVDPSLGKPFVGKNTFSGVSALTALPDGTLLVLEREFSMKVLPSFRIRIYRITLGQDKKELIWEAATTFANYEGMCLGPSMRQAPRTLVLISDGGGAALENVMVLSLSGL